MKATITLEFGSPGYVANPYWPEVEWLVKLQQLAGCHPKHGTDKRKKLLDAYCSDQGIDPKDIDKAKEKIENEKWYRDTKGKILIPRHHFSAALVQSLNTHPLKKEVNKNEIRTFLSVNDLVIHPDKKKCDCTFRRYIKNPESNLRRYQEDEVIENFTATGVITYADEVLNEESLESLINFAGKWTGVGACRKMGYGKFKLIDFKTK